jgi:hypothetical protein
LQCATHPTVETELACSRCGKPICPRCMYQTPVGARCRECANVRRIPTYNIAPATLGRAVAGALIGGAVLGIAWWFFNPITYFFFGVVAGLGVGFGVGESVALSTNRRAGPPLQAIAVGGVVVAYLARTGLLFAASGWVFHDVQTDLAGLIAFGLAAFIAAGRLR